MTSPAPLSVTACAEGLIFQVRVQPKSSRNRAAGVQAEALKLNLTAPPVDGAANRMCLAYLAELLAVPRSRLEILSGHAGRSKRILLHCDPAQAPAVAARLQALARPRKTA
jgi:hypothetical protein